MCIFFAQNQMYFKQVEYYYFPNHSSDEGMSSSGSAAKCWEYGCCY